MRQQRFLGYLPGCIILKTCEDAGSCSADKELVPGYFSFISVYFSQLEPLFQFRQPVRKHMLSVIIFTHMIDNGVHRGYVAKLLR